mmetsp:Transcript_10872/g.30535  ORF Transcript_10872/g.30535 Transcript_10872/m.30535 type:complete len:246 (-) Transcript_10872:1331-2068(-)
MPRSASRKTVTTSTLKVTKREEPTNLSLFASLALARCRRYPGRVPTIWAVAQESTALKVVASSPPKWASRTTKRREMATTAALASIRWDLLWTPAPVGWMVVRTTFARTTLRPLSAASVAQQYWQLSSSESPSELLRSTCRWDLLTSCPSDRTAAEGRLAGLLPRPLQPRTFLQLVPPTVKVRPTLTSPENLMLPEKSQVASWIWPTHLDRPVRAPFLEIPSSQDLPSIPPMVHSSQRVDLSGRP